MARNSLDDTHIVNQIKAGTHIEGTIKAVGDFRLDGTLKGNIQTEGKLVLGTAASVQGDISCMNAEIHGAINGKVTVNELLSLKASSKILGDMVVGRLSIEPGAQFSGSCVMGNAVKGLYNGQDTSERTEQRRAQAVS